jgi:hypothetical protein
MNYYTRCRNRIELSGKIEMNHVSVLFTSVEIDSDLKAEEVVYPAELETQPWYRLKFKNVTVPLNNDESRELYNRAIQKMEYLEELQNQEILKDL